MRHSALGRYFIVMNCMYTTWLIARSTRSRPLETSVGIGMCGRCAMSLLTARCCTYLHAMVDPCVGVLVCYSERYWLGWGAASASARALVCRRSSCLLLRDHITPGLPLCICHHVFLSAMPHCLIPMWAADVEWFVEHVVPLLMSKQAAPLLRSPGSYIEVPLLLLQTLKQPPITRRSWAVAQFAQ